MLGVFSWETARHMQFFSCPHCHNRVYFDNTDCERCGSPLFFDPNSKQFIDTNMAACSHRDLLGCNWLADNGGPHCAPCAHNAIIPPHNDSQIKERWAKAERAKKRLYWSLLSLGLWTDIVAVQSPTLRYRLLSPNASLPPGMEHLVVGHADGLLTLDISEASTAEVQKRRESLGEPYRTLLGHFRHEFSHYLWDVYVKDTGYLELCRSHFGDERLNYSAALHTHYSNGAPPDWQARHISSYASCHPWEDWAESCAHVLHMLDLIETDMAHSNQPFDMAAIAFTDLLQLWYPLVERLNSLNRSLGHEDAYPFVISPVVETKLSFVLDVLRSQ